MLALPHSSASTALAGRGVAKTSEKTSAALARHVVPAPPTRPLPSSAGASDAPVPARERRGWSWPSKTDLIYAAVPPSEPEPPWRRGWRR